MIKKARNNELTKGLVMFYQTLKFTGSNFDRIHKGKTTTIRLGCKCFDLDKPVRLLNEDTNEEVAAQIIEVRHVRFFRLGLLDAVADGFNSEEELRAELERVYQKEVEEADIVTVIRFKKIWIRDDE
ncbi:ASCH domain-containing protein [Vibrio parahaemolyticus]|uniref:ASCH domain-containing protein n=2 Tax=Vibrio parahaemolyticus TaxID=670 RepID=UPI000A1F3F8C|nr:ASCH domain-containing protein [Vibrio parahaemolyticus]